MGNLIRIINGRRNLKQIVVAVMGVDNFALMVERSFEEMQRHLEYNKIPNYWNNLASKGIVGTDKLASGCSLLAVLYAQWEGQQYTQPVNSN
jgi:hypothetical protein